MRKNRAITIETTRPRDLRTLVGKPAQKLEQDKYQGTDPGDSTTNDQDAGSTSSATAIEIDPSDPPMTDDIGSGQTIYQRLTLTSGVYCPSLPLNFYRRVWYDGLEAFQNAHFLVNSNGCVVPLAVLDSGTIVTATYVKN